MQALSYPLEELLPHREPMILIDEVVSFDDEKNEVVASVAIKPSWNENWVAIELMAQTAAALAGLNDRREGYEGAPRPGFLLGTRKLELAIERFAIGETYEIVAKCLFADGEGASFECAIRDKEKNVVATATLNAYRPSNATEFIKEQNA